MTETTTPPAKGHADQAAPERTRGGACFTPRVDIVETDAELTLFADLPGVNPRDVELRFENAELVLHGRAKARSNGRPFLAREYDVGDFYRAFTIHESIDGSKIEAEFKNGVLVVHLPKREKARPRQIAVRGG